MILDKFFFIIIIIFFFFSLLLPSQNYSIIRTQVDINSMQFGFMPEKSLIKFPSWQTMRKLGDKGWFIKTVEFMYSNARSSVEVNNQFRLMLVYTSN